MLKYHDTDKTEGGLPVALPNIANLRQLPHACIVSAASAEEALRGARELAAAIVCSGENPPCGHCRDCRKAAQGIHPDIQTVRRQEDDKGRLRREITVDQIRAMAADAIVLPNEAARKVYLLLEAETMNPAAQNAALKLLEEPPAGVHFLLCSTNPMQLLPTVRSRCVEYSLGGEAAGSDEEQRKLAAGYLKALAGGDRLELLRWCLAHEGMDNRQAADFIGAAEQRCVDILCQREEDPGLGRDGLLRLHALLERCAQYLRVNTGVKHIFGLLGSFEPQEDRN